MNTITKQVLWLTYVLFPTSLLAESIAWVDWTSAQNGKPGIVLGEIKSPGKTISIQYTGEVFFAQTSGGINYWEPSAPFISDFVANPPPNEDIITATGGNAIMNTITFSEPVNNPVMAIVSLGKSNSEARYNFNTPFVILKSDTGFFGGDQSTLYDSLGNTLSGKEGHGLIQFPGPTTSISWITPSFDTWQGFTFGVATKSSSSEDNIGTVAPNLDLFLPALKFQSPTGEIKIWGELEYFGEDLNGNLLWRLKDYGEIE